MNDEDKALRNTAAATINGAESIAEMGYLELESTANAIRTRLSGDEVTLDQRPALLDSLVLVQKRMMALSGTDSAYDQSDREYKNREIINDYLEKGDIKSALEFNKTLEQSGDKVANVAVKQDEATKAYYDKIKEARDARVPALMKDLNLNKEQAEQWFDDNESMDRWGNRPSIVGTEAEPEKPEAPERPEGQDSMLP